MRSISAFSTIALVMICHLIMASPAIAQDSAASCPTITVIPGGELAVVYLNRGDGVSSAAAGSLDQETTATYIDIEPGAGPLSLLLSSFNANIWILRGAVDRVTNVVLASEPPRRILQFELGLPDEPAAGIVGMPNARANAVTVASLSRCFDSLQQIASRDTGLTGAELVAAVSEGVGREVALAVVGNSATSISLPSGRVVQTPSGAVAPPEGFHPEVWRHATTYHPAGIIAVDPATVVGASAQAYDVLPNQIGLSQLAGAGTIEYLGGIDDHNIGDYRVMQQIPRYPAELSGAMLARFILEPGVPEPRGWPGDSCVIVRATGEARGVCMQFAE